MDSHFVRKIMIDSRFRKSGTPSDFTFELNRAITLPSKCAGFITDIELVHSWYNVDTHNEFFYFLEGFVQAKWKASSRSGAMVSFRGSASTT